MTRATLALIAVWLAAAAGRVDAARPPATTRPTAATRPTIAATAARQAAPPGAPAPVPAAPVLSAETSWAPWMLMAAGGLVVVALLVGPWIRSALPDDIPETHSHDEPPGASHHHGPGGTVDLVMPERD